MVYGRKLLSFLSSIALLLTPQLLPKSTLSFSIIDFARYSAYSSNFLSPENPPKAPLIPTKITSSPRPTPLNSWVMDFSKQNFKTLNLIPEHYLLAPGYEGSAILFNGDVSQTGVSFKTIQPFWKKSLRQGFTIEFYFQPNPATYLHSKSILLQKKGVAYRFSPAQNKKIPVMASLQIGLQKGRLFAKFENSFVFGVNDSPDQKRLPLLSLAAPIPTSKPDASWHHVFIRYVVKTKKISLYLNGKLAQRRYVTQNQSPDNPPYYFNLPELIAYPLQLGKNFLGKIDKLAFYAYPLNSSTPNEAIRQDYNSYEKYFFIAKYQSKPIRFPMKILPKVHSYNISKATRLAQSFVKIKKVLVKGNLPLKDLSLSLCSKLFLTDQQWKCSSFPPNAEIHSPPPPQFYQLNLRYHNYDNTPKYIDAIVFNYEPLLPPPPPKILQITQQKGSKKGVTLVWERGNEKIAGYRIYYYKKNFENEKQNKKVLFAQLAKKKEIPNVFSYSIDSLEPNVLYSFVVSAFKLAPQPKNTTEELESLLSNVVSIRTLSAF